MSGIIGAVGSKSGVIGTTELNYEEGTWDVVMKGDSNVALTTSAQSGYYTRIGNLVYATGYIVVSSLNSAIGAAYISGFPFVTSNIAAGHSQQGGPILEAAGLAVTAGSSLTCEMEEGSAGSGGYIKKWNEAGGTSNLTCPEFSADGNISFCLTYKVD